MSIAVLLAIIWTARTLVDWPQVWAAILDMSWLEITTLVLAAAWNIATYLLVMMAAMPGLSYRQRFSSASPRPPRPRRSPQAARWASA